MFNATQSTSIGVTVSNIGGVPINIQSISAQALLGSAVITESNDTCSTTVPLSQNSSCTFRLNLSDMQTDINKPFIIKFNSTYYDGTAFKNYSRILTLYYTANEYRALLALSPLDNVTIINDGIDVESRLVTITNMSHSVAASCEELYPKRLK